MSVWIDHPVFDKYSYNIFQDGRIFPYFKNHTMKLEEKLFEQLYKHNETECHIEKSIPLKTVSLEYIPNNNLLRSEK